MTVLQDNARPMGRCPVAHGFDAMGDDYYHDPARHLAEVRDATPVFWYPYLNAWIVTKREDCLTVLSDWQTYSSAATPPRTSRRSIGTSTRRNSWRR